MSSQGRRWFGVPLTPEQKDALAIAAKKNTRDARRQAQRYIAEGLSRDGLLDTNFVITCPHCQGALPVTEFMIIDALGVEPKVETGE